MSRKKALITGVSGQDGLALADFLIKKNYEVLGVALHDNRASHYKIVRCDIRDTVRVRTLLDSFHPDEVYNLAAISNIQACESDPELALAVNCTAWIDFLDLMTVVDSARKVRLFQASTSEIFGNAAHAPQTEETPLAPRNVYGVSKTRAHEATVRYREEFGLRACNGILYNHEGPDRGQEFVTRKITRGAAALRAGGEEPLQLGDLDAERDWGHVRDTVRGMWLMLQQDQEDDFILATGKTHTVRQFAELAFEVVGLPLKWVGEGVNEQALCRTSGRVLIAVNQDFMRQESLETLVGDATKARERIGWSPEIGFEEMVKEMVSADLARHKKKL